MRSSHFAAATLVVTGALAIPQAAAAQGTIADYQRAMTLRDTYDGLALYVADTPRWIGETPRFYYRRTVKGGHEWMLVDATTREKTPAFDHARLADAMYPGKDPYFVHYYRINFDGTGLMPLTQADANHAITFSPDRKVYVDSYSRVDDDRKH